MERRDAKREAGPTRSTQESETTPGAAEHATADHIARIKLAAAKVERSHLKQNALDDALAPLMKLAAAYRNQSDQDALALPT